MGRILIIDDDEQIRVMLREILSREGYEIEEAENGESVANYPRVARLFSKFFFTSSDSRRVRPEFFEPGSPVRSA